MRYCLDIETTTDFKTIRMVGIKAEDGGEFLCVEHPKDLLLYLPRYSHVITWNGSAFDFPMIERLWGIDLLAEFKEREIVHIDAYLVSKLVFNDRPSHSLDSYAGEFLGRSKLQVDYDNCTLANLSAYCEVDCILTLEVFRKLEDAVAKASSGTTGPIFKTPLKLEQHVARLIKEQEFHGFNFDKFRAKSLVEDMNDTITYLEEKAKEFLPVVDLPPSKIHNPPKIQFKKDGSVSVALVRYITEYCKGHIKKVGTALPVAVVNRVEYRLPIRDPLVTTHQLSLSNQTELKKYLLEKGWAPTIWNTKKVDGKVVKTSPRLTDPVSKEPCPNLARVLDPEHSKVISLWLTYRSRKNIIASDNNTGLLFKAEGTMYGRTGIIHHSADTLGTPTGRFIHRDIVNIPRVGSTLGREVRRLFIPREGMVMVGWDASSLEACMEAHYVYPFDPEYSAELMDGDIHTKNQRILDLPDRATAKTFKYAITYGAGAPRLASSLSVPLAIATRWYNDFWANNHGLFKLKAEIERDWQSSGKKYITGLDGRLLLTRSQHSLLNTKLQGAGAIVMKYALVLANKRIKEAFGANANALIRYHDEEQWECLPEIAEEVGRIGVQSITDAGEILGLNVPLTGEYKVGKNWAETH